MAIVWAKKGRPRRCLEPVTNIRINVNGTKAKNRRLCFRFSTSNETWAKLTRTGYVEVGFDRESELFYMKESTSKDGYCLIKAGVVQMKYVRVPVNNLRITDSESHKYEGDYTYAKQNEMLAVLKKVKEY